MVNYAGEGSEQSFAVNNEGKNFLYSQDFCISL